MQLLQSTTTLTCNLQLRGLSDHPELGQLQSIPYPQGGSETSGSDSPEKARVGGSIPSLATTLLLNVYAPFVTSKNQVRAKCEQKGTIAPCLPDPNNLGSRRDESIRCRD